ncbi:HD family phosphohydrolase [Candidatus Omnitrophota bacterium]
MRKIKTVDLAVIIVSVLFILVIGAIFNLYNINISLLILVFFFAYYIKGLRRKPEPDYLSLCFLFVLGLVCLIVSKNMGLEWYAAPIIALAILINVLYMDIEFSFSYLTLICILGSAILDYNFKIFLIYMVSGSTAIFLSVNVRKRFDIIKAGALAGFMQFLMAVGLMSFAEISSLRQSLGLSLFNGIISSSLIIAFLLWFFERLLGVITNISLLELSDFNHPLLRRMILEAPGTYQHSLVVANLAEAAAESIGANSLLVRVGAYYHDIGKISKSEYFSENQMLSGYKDKHKNLTPAMSKLIIMNHVKEGVELARKHHFNRKIIDFIGQHHGTTLVYYFFRRAQETKSEDTNSDDVYRYPGPRPGSKEVALVHLADTIEARSRVLDEATPARIKEMVKEAILNKFLDGQLDASELTLRDLEKVAEVFTRLLNAMFHTRVDYPKPLEDEAQNNH